MEDETTICVQKNPKRVFRPSKTVIKGIPPEIENDAHLKKLIETLPSNYNFEIPKTIWRIQKAKAKRVAFQYPEGLCILMGRVAEIVEDFTGVIVHHLGEVTYGACCVELNYAKFSNIDMIVHYGHSCLIPMDPTSSIPCLYVFVNIQFDTLDLLEKIKANFPKTDSLALVSIIQFVSSLQAIAVELKTLGYNVHIPQAKPLSPGEILGCTSVPVSKEYKIICLGDGKFHLESMMISNPGLETYLYNPYSKILSREYYDQPAMKKIRKVEIDKASKAKHWGIINGALGEQGSLKVLANIKEQCEKAGKTMKVISAAEIFQATINHGNIDAWVQIACPRLSIDWGVTFDTPLLNPYEASVALKTSEWDDTTYPMDNYAYASQGPWTPNHNLSHSMKKRNCDKKTDCCLNKS